jgi:hypothetical protein
MSSTVTVTLVFLAGLLVDLAYVAWIRAVAAGHKFLAAASSMAIGGCGMLGVTGVVTEHWLAVPYLAGLGAGTVLGMRR